MFDSHPPFPYNKNKNKPLLFHSVTRIIASLFSPCFAKTQSLIVNEDCLNSCSHSKVSSNSVAESMEFKAEVTSKNDSLVECSKESTVDYLGNSVTTKNESLVNCSEELKAEVSTKNYDSLDEVAAMKKAVKLLHFGRCDEKLAAVAEVKRFAAGDPRRKRLLAALGVVPSLVSMLFESQNHGNLLVIVEALNELANGSFKIKALIVEAGLLEKMPWLLTNQNLIKNEEFASLLLSITSLTKTQVPIRSEPILPFLVHILNNRAIADETKLTTIASLYNLSTKLDNVRAIVLSGAVQTLLELSQNKKVTEGTLATLGNLMLSEVGKKAIENNPMVPETLIEVMSWDDNPKTTELAAYILMVLAHGSKVMRLRMRELRIIPLLLQVSLLGSPLAQKRAVKMLQWFKDEGKVRAHSGPQAERYAMSSGGAIGSADVRECKKAVRRMVRQSLDKNVEVIFTRAQANSEDFSCFKSLSATSSSKSLPF